MATSAELQKKIDELKAQHAKALIEEATPAYNRIIRDLTDYAANFSADQRKAIQALVADGKPQKKESGKIETPKYLANGKYWAGRGKTPKAFEEWKKANPDKDYPLNPAWVELNKPTKKAKA